MWTVEVAEWIEQLRGDRQTLDEIMLRLGVALNGPARRVQRITETKIAHGAVDDAIAALDQLIARVPAPADPRGEAPRG
jgi:hypothetical protein